MLLLFSLNDNEKINIIEEVFNKNNIQEFLDFIIFFIGSMEDNKFKSKYLNIISDSFENSSVYCLFLNSTIDNEELRKQNLNKLLSRLVNYEEKLKFIVDYERFFGKDIIIEKMIEDISVNFDYIKISEFINTNQYILSNSFIEMLFEKILLSEKIQLISYIYKINVSNRFIELMTSQIPIENINYLVDIMDDKRIVDILSFYDLSTIMKNFDYILQNNISYTDLIELLQFNNLLNDIYFLDKNINSILFLSSRDYNISLDRLKKIYDLFGCQIVAYLNNENIQKVLKLSDNEFNKIIELFSSSGLNKQNINTVYNSLVQIEFGTKNPEVFQYSNELLSERDENVRLERIREIITEEYIKILLKQHLFLEYLDEKKYTYDYCYNNIDIIVNELVKEILDLSSKLLNIPNDDEKSKQIKEKLENRLKKINAILNIILIGSKRELYLKEKMKDIDKDMKLPKTLVKDKIVSKVIFELSIDELINLFKNINLKSLTEDQKLLILNQEILLECIKFKKNPQQYQENIQVITKRELLSKYLKTFNKLTEILFNRGLLNDYASEDEMETIIPKSLGDFGIQVLANLDYNNIISHILFSDYYDDLKKVMQMYGFLGIKDIFGEYMEKLGIEFDVDSIATLIEFYPFISQKLSAMKSESKIISMKNYLNLASCYSPTGFFNKILFGREDLEYLKNNPGPNVASGLVGSYRIDKALEYIPIMFKRESITVPTINEEISNNNGDKTLRVVIGDVTGMINFTYGERTGACMRIGGAAATLLDFAMRNDNGFHIRFEDPKTGEFISRVTCYRNGNTLFLNQLRHSVNTQYTDDDLCDICTKAANALIERTKDSKFPINNVVISVGEAMKNNVSHLFMIDIPNTRKGYEDFYSDLDKGVKYILATSAKDKLYEDVLLNPNMAEKYPVLRGKIKVYANSDEAVLRINQLNIINKLMLGNSLGEVEPLKMTEVQFAMSGDDWYAYLDCNGQIQSKILDNLPESKRNMALSELKNALSVLQTKINEDTLNMGLSETLGGTYGRK